MSRGPAICHLVAIPRQHLYFTPSIEVMLDQIELVFRRLKEYHLKIKTKKCHFFDTSVLFFSHVLSARGISTNPKKVEKVWNWPAPSNAKEVRSFLGLAFYYQRFIPKYAWMAHCSHKLVGPTSTKPKKIKGQKKEKPAAQGNPTETKDFNWMPEHQQAFDVLKEPLVTAPVLGYPNFNREFMLETNASLQGFGAV